MNKIFSTCYYLGLPAGTIWPSFRPMSTSVHVTSSDSLSNVGTATSSNASTVTVNHLRSTLKLSTLKCCLTIFDTVVDQQIPIKMLGFLNVQHIISQIVETSQLLGLGAGTEQRGLMQGMRKRAGSVTAGIRVVSHSEWRPGQAHNLAPTDDAATSPKMAGHLRHPQYMATYEWLRWEVTRMYELLRYLMSYDESGDISTLVSQFSKEHKDIVDYLERHVGSVDVVRTVRVSESPLKPAGASGVEEDVTETRVQAKQYTVSEHMAKLIESNHFRQLWSNMLYLLPLDNPEDKFAMLMDTIQDVIAMAIWMNFLNQNSPVMRTIIRHRETLGSLPLYLSLAITMLLIVFYGIPLDPNTGNVVGDGRFHPVFTFAPHKQISPPIYVTCAAFLSLFCACNPCNAAFGKYVRSRTHAYSCAICRLRGTPALLLVTAMCYTRTQT